MKYLSLHSGEKHFLLKHYTYILYICFVKEEKETKLYTFLNK